MKRLRLGVVSAGLRSHSWLEKADDPSVSKPHTPSAPSQLCHLQSSFPTVAAASPVCGHAHPPSRPCALCIAPNVLLFKLYGTFFFFFAKVMELLGTSLRKLRCTKKNVIISLARLPKPLQDTHKINTKFEACILPNFPPVPKKHTNSINKDIVLFLFSQKNQT